MDVEGDVLCPCGSGKQIKRCCLDDLVAWHNAGKGLIATYVDLEDGRRVALHEWSGPLSDEMPLITELNPVTAAWIRNTFPAGIKVTDPTCRALLLEHFAAMIGYRLGSSPPW